MRSKRSAKPRSRSTTPTFPRDWSEFLSPLDVFVEPTMANAKLLHAALAEFGFGRAAPEAAVLATPDRVFMLGVKPLRIDVGLEQLRKNKRAAGRTKDLLDLAELDRRKAPR